MFNSPEDKKVRWFVSLGERERFRFFAMAATLRAQRAFLLGMIVGLSVMWLILL